MAKKCDFFERQKLTWKYQRKNNIGMYIRYTFILFLEASLEGGYCNGFIFRVIEFYHLQLLLPFHQLIRWFLLGSEIYSFTVIKFIFWDKELKIFDENLTVTIFKKM